MSTVEMVEETEIPDTRDYLNVHQLRSPQPAPRPRVTVQYPTQEVMGVFNAIAFVLAGRFLLLLAVVGAFALAWRAMDNPAAIWVLIAYCCLCLVPTAISGFFTRGAS
ncbi:MAG: hypothetical protein AB7J28_17210 [Hyphomonadaceae bacterium]